MPNSDHFELPYRNQTIHVQRHSLSGETIFRVLFEGKTAPLVLHRALDNNANRFWTSIPEGRQQEAEEIGNLISEYLL